jgi:glycosyltransferase involved in cell wall biosynthesis
MVATSYPKYHGDTTAPFIAEIAAGVAAHGHAVRVVLPHHREFRHNAVERGVELFTFAYAPHPSLAVWGYAESLKADVGLKQSALMAAPFAVPATMWALHQHIQAFKPDIIHAHWLLPNGLPAWVMSRVSGIPLVVSMHGSDVAMAERNQFFRAIAQRIFAHSRMNTACSGDLHYRALKLGAVPNATHVLPYGVAVDAFDPTSCDRAWVAERFGIAADAPLLVAVGRFVYKKGFHTLIESLVDLRKTHPPIRLLLVGYGDLQDEYTRRASELGVADMLIMPGQLLRDDVAKVIASADVYCVPSVHDESGNVDGLPNALLEGMAAGRAVVASDVAGIPDVIRNGEHGVLVPEGDAGGLARAIAALIDSPSNAQVLGQNARRRIVEELTWPHTTAQLVTYYQEALRR